MKTFVGSGLQITAEARGKANARVTDAAAARRETEIVYTISVCAAERGALRRRV